jgi:serine/threonine protein kinase
MAEQQPRHVGDWVLEREIGSGSFAKVWRATHRSTQQVAAVKEINMDKLNKKLQESLRSEVTVLRHTKHRNIVCLLDLIQVRLGAWPGLTAHKQDLCMHLKQCSGCHTCECTVIA